MMYLYIYNNSKCDKEGQNWAWVVKGVPLMGTWVVWQPVKLGSGALGCLYGLSLS